MNIAFLSNIRSKKSCVIRFFFFSARFCPWNIRLIFLSFCIFLLFFLRFHPSFFSCYRSRCLYAKRKQAPEAKHFRGLLIHFFWARDTEASIRPADTTKKTRSNDRVFGADEGTWTPTVSLPLEPESSASANSATSAYTVVAASKPEPLALACFVEQVMGVEPTSSAWKADVLAVVRQPRNNSTYYTHLRGCLSSPPGRVFLPLLPFCHFILHFAPMTILSQSTKINTEYV